MPMQPFLPHSPEAAHGAVALLKALSNVHRLQILCLLIDQPMNVGDIATALGQEQAPISQHLMRLRLEGIVQTERQGKHVTYALERSEVKPVIQALRAVFRGR